MNTRKKKLPITSKKLKVINCDNIVLFPEKPSLARFYMSAWRKAWATCGKRGQWTRIFPFLSFFVPPVLAFFFAYTSSLVLSFFINQDFACTLLAKLRCPGCPFIQRNSFSWHNPLADPLAQKCNGGTSMAFLQICRRHQKLFEGASASVKLLLTRKGFQSCRILHSHESKHLRVGKKDYSFPCVKKYAPGSREMFLVLIRDNQKIMKIKNNNNQSSDEAEAEYKLNNLACRGWFISTPMRLSDVLRKIEWDKK